MTSCCSANWRARWRSSGVSADLPAQALFDRGGSGLHVNLSFADAGGNALATGPKGGIAGMNDLARGCIAGWMRHHKGLAALVAPTVNSYARLQPATMSGYWCNWGEDHRGVTVRISGEGGKKARLEHRMADASRQSLCRRRGGAAGSAVGGGGGYPLPAHETGDCFTGNDATEGVAASLGQALEDLEADAALMAAMGAEYCAHHVHMKRVEVAKQDGKTPEAARDFYIWFV
jgi:glutamine synthetase